MQVFPGGSVASPAPSPSLRDAAGGRQEEWARPEASDFPRASATKWLEHALLEERQAVQSFLKERHDTLICKLAAQTQTSQPKSNRETSMWTSACPTAEGTSGQPDPTAQRAGSLHDDGRPPEGHALCSISLPGVPVSNDLFAVDAAAAVDKGANLHKLKDESQPRSGRNANTRSSACSTAEGKSCQPDPITQPASGFSKDIRSPGSSHAQCTILLPGASATDDIFTEDAAEAVDIGKSATTAVSSMDDQEGKGATVHTDLAHTNSSPKLNNSPSMSFQSGKLVSSRTTDEDCARKEDVPEPNTFLRIASAPAFEVAVSALIMLNAIAMALDIQYKSFGIGYQLQYRWHGWNADGTLQFEGSTPYGEHIWPWGDGLFDVLDWVFGIVFTCELIVKAFGYKWAWFKDPWNHLDATIVVFWLLERGFANLLEGHSSLLRLCRVFRLLRLMKVVRTLKGFDSLYLLVTTLKGSFWILSWSCLLLFTVEMLCAMLMWLYLKETYFTAEEYPLKERQAVFEYFGSFSRAMLTMFEMALANWPPVCRLLVENVNEWMLIFCLVHKLTLGFAVVGVINGVFLQETFKVASTDDRIMVRQRERDVKVHTDRMGRLFEAADADHNGMIDVEEFVQFMQDQTVLSWLSSMDLSVRDPMNLFQLLDDDGDGFLSCEELVRGSLKMKGNAKSLDVMSMKRELAEVKRELKEFSLLLTGVPSDRRSSP